MKLLLVINPISGGIDKKPFLNTAKKLLEKYGVNYHIFKTTGQNDENVLMSEIKSFRPDRIAAAGGDGSFLFVALAVLETKIPVGVIPFGSANGMSKELGVPQDPIEALKDIICSQLIVGLDLIKVNDKHYSLHLGDVGINANLVGAYEKDENRGMITYAKYFIKELQNLKPFKATIQANGKLIETSSYMLAFCNGRKYGTGVPLNLISNPLDGLMEIVSVEQIDTPGLINSGLSKFSDDFHDHQKGQIIQTKEATITFDQPRLLQLDGEVIGQFDELDLTVYKGAVHFISILDNEYIN